MSLRKSGIRRFTLAIAALVAAGCSANQEPYEEPAAGSGAAEMSQAPRPADPVPMPEPVVEPVPAPAAAPSPAPAPAAEETTVRCESCGKTATIAAGASPPECCGTAMK